MGRCISTSVRSSLKIAVSNPYPGWSHVVVSLDRRTAGGWRHHCRRNTDRPGATGQPVFAQSAAAQGAEVGYDDGPCGEGARRLG